MINDDDKTDPGITPPPIDRQRKKEIKMPDMGILKPFMEDESITDIMVNDTRNIMVEKNGKLMYPGVAFLSIEDLNKLVRNILDITGRLFGYDHPYLDVMLPDGSRVNMVGTPLTIDGPCITIRKLPHRRFTLDDLVRFNSLEKKLAYFLSTAVTGRLNMLISGGTGSGKTTFLNALASLIPADERIVTIEDTPELVIQHLNNVRLQTKPQTPSSAAVTTRDLVANALRMRPDRIIVGECRRSEAFDMLQAMNTGHDGSMTTIHANSPRDALSRLETLIMLAGIDMPLKPVRQQIVSTIDFIIHVKRYRDGARRVAAISEATGMEGEMITLQDIFSFDTVSGQFKWSGLVPKCTEDLEEAGISFPKNFFS
ncbi:MAG: CpaF family protein [Bdellovibrionota bacterium]